MEFFTKYESSEIRKNVCIFFNLACLPARQIVRKYFKSLPDKIYPVP